MKRFQLLVLLTIFFSLPTFAADKVTLKIGKQTLHAEIANTPVLREHGLMGREKLCSNCGMLFVFPKLDIYRFWMKNTPSALSIAFVAADGRIININEMQPNTLDIHSATAPVLYALEMDAGWFSQHHIQPNQTLRGIHQAPSARD
jgi:uncharacterized protein